MELIKSISFDQDEILENIVNLYIPSGVIDCDPCYSIGNFYNKIEQPKLCYDIKPKFDFVKEADCRHLNLSDESLDSIIFDPPFLATTGASLNINDDSNKLNKRFGVYDSEKELHQMYIDSMIEFYRILRDGGILIFKCQDKISSGKQYLSHCFIINEAEKIGFYCEDMFILLAKNRLVADWQLQNQKHARKFHCYFLVFRKCNKTIQYI